MAGPASALPHALHADQQFLAEHGRSASSATSPKRLRRGVFRDVEELIMAIGDYVDQHNENPKPFIWTAKASDILEKVKRLRSSLPTWSMTSGVASSAINQWSMHC